jgi:hypothetical protein
MLDRIRAWIENPILVKHIRTRLRRQSILTSLSVVVLLCLCIAYAGYALDIFKNGFAAGMILAIQFVLLVIMGSSQVGASVSGARNSGILDFHRVSPMTPTELTLGFFFGAPIREYSLFAATLPFTVLCMAFGIPSPRGFVQLMMILLTSAWTLQGLVLLTALASKGKTPTGGVVAMLVFLLFFGSSLVMGGQFSANMVEHDNRLGFFGLSLPWLPVVLLYQLPLLFFILLASTRKMESARLHALSKPQGIVAMLVFSTLVVGGIWRKDDYEIYEIAALYLLTIPALLVTLVITPSQAEYAKGLYRAQRQGKTRLPWWDDLSVSWITLVLLAGMMLGAGTLAGSVAAGAPSPHWQPATTTTFHLALAAAVLTVAYFGLAFQYFQLRFAKRGPTYFTLFIFIVWFLPIIAGAIQSMASGPRGPGEVGAPLFALSPGAGIGMIAAIGDEHLATRVQAAAITPALLFTFVFNYLLIGARRRVMRIVFLATAKKDQDELELVFDEPVADARGIEPIPEAS